jgi:hypothetical protein
MIPEGEKPTPYFTRDATPGETWFPEKMLTPVITRGNPWEFSSTSTWVFTRVFTWGHYKNMVFTRVSTPAFTPARPGLPGVKGSVLHDFLSQFSG